MDTPHPVTGLTGRQVQCIQDNWKEICNNQWKDFFNKFFMRLFGESAQVLSFFHAFEGMTMEEISKSGKLRAHMYNFKAGLDGFVTNLEDPDCLLHLIEKLTDNHFKRGIGGEEFKTAFKIFMDYNKEEKNINEETEVAWTAAIGVVCQLVEQCLQKLEEAANAKA